MRWSLLVAVFGLSISDVASFAQGPHDAERLSTAHSSPEDAGFFETTGVVRFQMIQGRLALDAPRHRKGSQSRDEDGVHESITVTAERGIPSLHYVYQTKEHHLTVSVQKASSMRIESWFPLSEERSVLVQPEFGELTWDHTRGDLKDEYTGTNLLHLRHCDQESFDLHFGYLIKRLRRGKSLRRLSDETEELMLRNLHTGTELDEAMIHEMVEQLGSPRRATRVQAERQLLTWGTPVIPSLHRAIGGDTDQEQKQRIRSILKRLRPGIDDSPASLAQLFVNDRSYWSRIANDLGHEDLRLTNLHLRDFGAAPIELSTAAEERIAQKKD